MCSDVTRQELDNGGTLGLGQLSYVNMPIPEAHNEDVWVENQYPSGWQRSFLISPLIAFVVGVSGSAPAPALAGIDDDQRQVANFRELHLVSLSEDMGVDEAVAKSSVVAASSMIDSVREYFGLNMAQAARVFNISRATLYNHINSSDAPVQSYQPLFRLVSKLQDKAVCGVEGKIKSNLIDGETLLDILYRHPLDHHKIEEACETLSGVDRIERVSYDVDAIRSKIAGLSKS